MLGPTGIGVLWMKAPSLEPLLLGGGVVERVTASGYTLTGGYQRYEAGTPNVGAGIGLGAAVDYLNTVGMDRIRDHERCLALRVADGLRGLPGVKVYGPGDRRDRTGIVSFTVEGIGPGEVAQHLDETSDLLVSAGSHDCQPLMEHLGLPGGTVRASMYLYNTEQETDLLVATVAELVRG